MLIYTKSNRTTKNIPPKAVIFSDFISDYREKMDININENKRR